MFCCDMPSPSHCSRVFYRQHKQIRNIIKMIVLQMIFDSKHLEDYILKKISHFSSNVQVVDNISAALSSPEAERIIEERMDSLYVQPEGQYLQMLGLSKLKLRPLIKPAILSLCAETAPMVLGTVGIPKKNEVSICRKCVGLLCTWLAGTCWEL